MEKNKIYSIGIHNQFINQKQTYKSFSFEKAMLKDNKEIKKQKSPLGRYRLKGEWIAKKKDELDYVEIAQHNCGNTPGKSIYPDFGSIAEFVIISQKALSFLDKHNINYWKLEKPVKIVNDINIKEKYYLIEFPEIDAVDYKLSKTKHIGGRVCEMIDDAPINSPVYFRPEAVEEIGIFWAYCGGLICNSKTKILLEESGLTGFEFEEQLLTSEKQEKKGFFKNLFSKD